ncbi:MAG TPA: transaldolase, partial [Bryobacteraceae bacterium]|nr:transaldolase [Bryobacteraceae bacterium]
MPSSPLQRLQSLGQSVWLDFIDRSMLNSACLPALLEKFGITGITTNPKIFSDAILAGGLYKEDILRAAREGLGAKATYERLAIEDVRRAAGLLRGIYDRTESGDGYVSLEVSPGLAYDTEGTVREAHSLWSRLETPNILVKIPATRQGLPAVRQMISDGISVNATLLFSVDRYRLVAEAYIAGLEARLAEGKPVGRVHSVASFFVSRIDALVDPRLTMADSRGKVALACARLAYQAWKELFGGERFRRLERHGARPQRLLWASTSPKDPSLSDLT